MGWDRNARHLGEVAEDTEVTCSFTYKGDLEYSHHKGSCGCITSKWDNGTIRMTFKTPKVPSLAKEAGKFYVETNKTVKVIFKDGSSTELIVKAFVIAKEWAI